MAHSVRSSTDTDKSLSSIFERKEDMSSKETLKIKVKTDFRFNLQITPFNYGEKLLDLVYNVIEYKVLHSVMSCE